MSKTSSAAKNRHRNKTYDLITVIVKKGEKEEWKQVASDNGYKSLSEYIVDAMKEKRGG